MTDPVTQQDVQLWTGTDPEKHAHYIRVADGGIPRVLDGGLIEALCGYRWKWSVLLPKGLPVCSACKAVFDDDEAMSLAGPGSS